MSSSLFAASKILAVSTVLLFLGLCCSSENIKSLWSGAFYSFIAPSPEKTTWKTLVAFGQMLIMWLLEFPGEDGISIFHINPFCLVQMLLIWWMTGFGSKTATLLDEKNQEPKKTTKIYKGWIKEEIQKMSLDTVLGSRLAVVLMGRGNWEKKARGRNVRWGRLGVLETPWKWVMP